MVFEYGFSGKWLELLKQIAPQVTRAAVIRDPTISSRTAQFGAIQAVAPALGVEVTPIGVSALRHMLNSAELRVRFFCCAQVILFRVFTQPTAESAGSDHLSAVFGAWQPQPPHGRPS
jgi:hypothetical protein